VNIKQKMVVVMINILVLVELGFSIYVGSQGQDMVLTFLMIYIPAVVVTIYLGRICIRRLG